MCRDSAVGAQGSGTQSAAVLLGPQDLYVPIGKESWVYSQKEGSFVENIVLDVEDVGSEQVWVGAGLGRGGSAGSTRVRLGEATVQQGSSVGVATVQDILEDRHLEQARRDSRRRGCLRRSAPQHG